MNRAMPYVICDIDGTPVTRNTPNRSSPNTGPSPRGPRPPPQPQTRPDHQAGKAPQQVLTGMTGQTPEGPTNEATFPAPILRG